MGWLAWIITGLLAGALAKLVTGVRGQGCLLTIVIGIAGALVGGALASWALGEGLGGFGIRSILIAFVGAAILLLLYGAIEGRSARRER